MTVWYDEPAANWNEALPLGNGRLGAMVFGEPAAERLQLNESTFWSGGPSRNDNPNALGALANVRQLIWKIRTISPSADLNEVVLDPAFVYDLPTLAGQAYVLAAKP